MKMSHHCAVILTSVLVVAGGCSNSAPKCSDQKTIDLVYEITKQELSKTMPKEVIDTTRFSLNATRTTAIDEKTGAQNCAAQLMIKGPKGEAPVDITYKSEKTDKNNQQIVTVWWL